MFAAELVFNHQKQGETLQINFHSNNMPKIGLQQEIRSYHTRILICSYSQLTYRYILYHITFQIRAKDAKFKI